METSQFNTKLGKPEGQLAQMKYQQKSSTNNAVVAFQATDFIENKAHSYS